MKVRKKCGDPFPRKKGSHSLEIKYFFPGEGPPSFSFQISPALLTSLMIALLHYLLHYLVSLFITVG